MSSNLLTSLNPGPCTGFDCDTETGGVGAAGVLSISPDSTGGITSLVEAGDIVEVAGSCVDLDRRNNRILVEVFAGTDESVNPYINNDISNECQQTNNAVTAGVEPSDLRMPSNVSMGHSQVYTFAASGGTPPYIYGLFSGVGMVNAGSGAFTSPAANGEAIISVTDGIGRVFYSTAQIDNTVMMPVATAVSNKCFWVTHGIGLNLTEAGSPVEKILPQCHNGRFGFSFKAGKAQQYKVRFKIRTIDGMIQDSPRGDVTVTRTLSPPLINTISSDVSLGKINLLSSPSRFNFNVLYSLSRTATDIVATTGAAELFTNTYMTTNILDAGSSVFNFDHVGVVDGVTYNYTLTARDISVAGAPALTTASSAVKSLMVPASVIESGGSSVMNTCFVRILSGAPANPYVNYTWGYSSTSAAWTGVNLNGAMFIPATCGNTSACTQPLLTAGTTYYFAVRSTGGGLTGKWSNTIACRAN